VMPSHAFGRLLFRRWDTPRCLPSPLRSRAGQ
jgi:hypothetical protein